jgi:type II secretory pathway component PulJ
MSAFALLASNTILLGVILALAWYFNRRLRLLGLNGDRVTALYIEQLQHQISVLQRDLRQLAERIERQQGAAPSDTPVVTSPYNQAIELIREGASAADVAQRCGISRSEAELIVSLYRNNSTS